MRLEFEITPQNLVEFNDHVFVKRFGRQTRLRAFWNGLAMAVLGGLGLNLLWHNSAAAFITSAILGIVMAVSLPGVERDQVRKMAAKMIRGERDASLGGQTLTFGDDVELKCSFDRSEYSWPAILEVDFAKAYAYLFTGPSKAIIVPRNAVPSEPEFEGLLKTKLLGVPFEGSWAGEGGKFSFRPRRTSGAPIAATTVVAYVAADMPGTFGRVPVEKRKVPEW